MLTRNQIALIMNGRAYLEYLANLYFFCGLENGKLIFQCNSDDSYIMATMNDLTTNHRYSIQF